MNLGRLAAVIRARREALRMTRAEVAAAAGCHWRTVENLERCDVDTRWGVVVAVAQVVGVTFFCVAKPEGAAHNMARAGRTRIE